MGFSHELEATDPKTEGLLFGACKLPSRKADKFGEKGLVVLTLPGSDHEVRGGGCTILGRPTGTMAHAAGMGVVTAAPGIPLSVCIS